MSVRMHFSVCSLDIYVFRENQPFFESMNFRHIQGPLAYLAIVHPGEKTVAI